MYPVQAVGLLCEGRPDKRTGLGGAALPLDPDQTSQCGHRTRVAPEHEQRGRVLYPEPLRAGTLGRQTGERPLIRRPHQLNPELLGGWVQRAVLGQHLRRRQELAWHCG